MRIPLFGKRDRRKAGQGDPAENAYARQLSETEIASGEHRQFVGGMWDEIGLKQFEFLKSHGLLPGHRLMDIGCGCLRGGVHFVPYLEKGRYYGIDINASLIEAGRKELAKDTRNKEKRPDLRVSDRFDLAQFGAEFDYALATSVFTHININHIGRCLVEVRKALAPKGKFFVTFFRAPAPLHLEPIPRAGTEIVTHFDRDPFHQSLREMEMLGELAGFSVELIGAWGHPRAQEMLCFTPV
jgi:cyclopropane fatty-acyl-phospholipid synthase-like methyltransferase